MVQAFETSASLQQRHIVFLISRSSRYFGGLTFSIQQHLFWHSCLDARHKRYVSLRYQHCAAGSAHCVRWPSPLGTPNWRQPHNASTFHDFS